MFDFLKNFGSGSGGGIEGLLSKAKFLGFDPLKMLEGQLPGWVEQANALCIKAGKPLFLTLALNDQMDAFVLALYTYDATGATELYRCGLKNLETLIPQILEDLTHLFPTHDTIKPDLQQQPVIGSPADEPAGDPAGTGTDESSYTGTDV